MKMGWIEREFEEWFEEHPNLPGKDRLLIVQTHRAIQREVDILALDRDGGLVIIEVKNETTTREGVGQAIEYLSQYGEATLDDIEEVYRNYSKGNGQLLNAFKATFPGRSLSTLSHQRRVVVVAPCFGLDTAICGQYLSDLMAPKHVSFHLVAAQRHSGGFALQAYAPEVRHSRKMAKEEFGKRPSGRVFCVLGVGPNPILWNTGRPRTASGSWLLPSAKALSKRALRRGSYYFVRCPQPDSVHLELSGTVWHNVKNDGRVAKLIGIVESKNGKEVVVKYAVFARFRPDREAIFRKELWPSFQKEWVENKTLSLAWTDCLEWISQARRGLPPSLGKLGTK